MRYGIFIDSLQRLGEGVRLGRSQWTLELMRHSKSRLVEDADESAPVQFATAPTGFTGHITLPEHQTHSL